VTRAPLLLAAGLLLAACARAQPVAQPIQFSHKAHVEKGLPCDGCHQSVEKAAFAGMPTTETCMMCHQGAITDSPEEEKVRQYAGKDVQIPWGRVYEVAGHVYFSHRRHVTLGRIECVQCHGNVGESATPLTVAAVPITMDRCVNCHLQNGAADDCNACHR
jgi:hypothetical protein